MQEKYTEIVPHRDENGVYWIYAYEWVANNGSYYLASCYKTVVTKGEYRKTKLALLYQNNEEFIGIIAHRLGLMLIESVFSFGGKILWKTTTAGLGQLTRNLKTPVLHRSNGLKNYPTTAGRKVVYLNEHRARR